jgi:hypothetical protein
MVAPATKPVDFFIKLRRDKFFIFTKLNNIGKIIFYQMLHQMLPMTAGSQLF